jgi:hypothetical protein
MALLKRLLESFSGPIVMTFAPTDGGATVSFRQNNRPLDPFASMPKRIPIAVLNILRGNAADETGTFIIPFEVARTLAAQLTRDPATWLVIDADAILRLEVDQKPAEFWVHWAFDAGYSLLRRQLKDAQLSLGDGWYLMENRVWRIPLGELGSTGRAMINASAISGPDIATFVTEVMPIAGRLGLPYSCDLKGLQPGMATIEILRTTEKNLELRLTSRQPSLLAQLVPLQSDPATLLSGRYLFPALGTFRGRRLPQLIAGETIRLSGEELLQFMVEVVARASELYGLDRVALERLYPITGFQTMRPYWNIEYKINHGIGRYIAALYFARGAETVSRQAVWARADARAGRTTPFVRGSQGWVQLPLTLRETVQRIDSQFMPDFPLDQNELLGVRTPRLAQLKLAPPALEPTIPTDSPTVALGQLNHLRTVGVTAGLCGYGEMATLILGSLCEILVAEYSAARIFWLASLKRQKAIKTVLAGVRVNAVIANRPADLAAINTVYLSDNYYAGAAAGTWTLTIFDEIETVLSSSFAAQAANFIRDWTIFTAATRPRAFVPGQYDLLLHALGIQAEAAERFNTACVISTPPIKEADTKPSPAKNQQPRSRFAQFIVGGAETPARGSFPVPARDKQQAAVPGHLSEPAPGSGATYPNMPVNFAAVARAYADRTEPHADPVPFAAELPTYSALRPEQARWYFYWRAQARAGTLLPTDIGYLLLYTFELINLVGIGNPGAAYRALKALWAHYRGAQPRLDGYLIPWIADFAAYFDLEPGPLGWYAEATAAGADVGSADLVCTAWRVTRWPLGEMPIEALFKVADYAPMSSKFYAEGDKVKLNAAFTVSVGAIDRTLREQAPASFGLLTPSPGARRATIARIPFLSARHSYPHKAITIAEIDAEPSDSLMVQHLQAIIRHTENLLRARAGQKGKLRVVGLPIGWGELIDQAQESLRPQRRVDLDPSKIQRLHQESAEVREMLTVDDDPALDARDPIAALTPSRPSTPPLTLPEADFITSGAPPDPPEAPPASEPIDPSPTPTETDSPDQPDYSALEPPWGEFARRLRPIDWKILDALGAVNASPAEAEQKIASLARDAKTFPSLLLEALNETALETTNELIVDTMEALPTLYEEMDAPIQALLRWAAQNPTVFSPSSG